MCKSVKTITTTTGSTRCVDSDYTDVTGLKGDFKPCDYQSDCSYTYKYKEATEGAVETTETYTKQCECGYSTKGQGYCPLPSARKSTEWTAKAKAEIEWYNPTGIKCHTSHRRGAAECIRRTINTSNDSKIQKLATDQFSFEGSRLIRSNRFVDSDTCHKVYLSSGIIKSSLAVLFTIIAFIF